MNQSIVCTLFEGNYHYGVAALVNSLKNHGYKGEVYAGYRGALPIWAKMAEFNIKLEWEDACTLNIEDGIQIHFLPLQTDYHLTNYKPDFMIRLCEGPAKNEIGIFYFDPDIVIKCRWAFFEKWISHGVAIVHEIISNDMPATHPIRLEWCNIINKNNGNVVHQIQSYINGGFVGLIKDNVSFLKSWSNYVDIAIKVHNTNPSEFMSLDRTYPYFSIDQDALNITAMSTCMAISEMGPEAMDFIHGGYTMSHAVGSAKPWKKNYIVSSLQGDLPTLADKEYWKNVNTTIVCYSKNKVRIKRLLIKVASFIGRFYRKS